MQEIRQVAVQAAREAGAILRERVGKISTIDYKSAFNLVTDVDKQSETHILSVIRAHFPDHDILAEESGAHKAGSSRRWVIDPLDGTTNFAHGYPFFAVSIGFEENGESQVAVVYNPMSDELFFAERGKGAFLNGEPIRVSANEKLSTCLLCTGFPADTRTARIANTAEFARLTDLTHGVRRDGSAALDLSFVACGRFDGFWELKLAPWDLAAGTLLVTEAGGRVTNLTGDKFDITTGHVVASNGKIHAELIAELRFEQTLAAGDNLPTSSDVARK